MKSPETRLIWIALVRWILIYPVDSALRPLNKWGLLVPLVWHCIGNARSRFKSRSGACFSNVPKLFGWHYSFCIFKMKVSRVTKICSYFNFYSLCNIWKDQLYRISQSEFYEWLFGPLKFSGLLRNARQGLSGLDNCDDHVNILSLFPYVVSSFTVI